eukprot:sb/3465680/
MIPQICDTSDLLNWHTRHGPTQAHLLSLVSAQFGTAQDHNPKFPLLIDPDCIGYTRIQEVEYNNKLVTIDMSNSESRALASLGRALTLGLPTVLLNIGTDLPSVIYPIFDQRRHLDGDGALSHPQQLTACLPTVETIKLGGQKFQYNRKFRLHICIIQYHSVSHNDTPGEVQDKPANEISISEILTQICDTSDLLNWHTRHGPTQAHLLSLVSAQFGTAQDHNPKFPLLIDPDCIGYTRIQEVEYNNKLVTIDMSNSESRALASLGRALTLGLPTVLLNIGTDLPSVIYPIFDQRRHLDGDGALSHPQQLTACLPTVETIKLGGQKFQYNRKFRLYLATTEPLSAMSSTLVKHTSVVNFTLTSDTVRELIQTALLSSVS